MKNIVIISIMQLLCISNILQAQMNYETIKNLSQTESSKISNVLSLNVYQEEKIASIYVDYYRTLSNAINSSTKYLRIVQEAEKMKNIEIEKVLGEHKFKSFLIFESIYTNESIEYYKSLYASLEKNEELEKEIANYYRLNIFPVISELRLEFDSKLSTDDKSIVELLKDTIYSCLIIQSDTIVNNTNRNHRKIYNQLLSIGDKYKGEYDKVQYSVEPFLSVWKSDLPKILSDYYTVQQIESFSAQEIELIKLGLLGPINELSFLILEPYDLLKFYKNLSLIQNIKDSASKIRVH